MPALDPSTTGDTAANFHVESPDDRPNHREIFLILGGNAHHVQRAPTIRARRRERRVGGHVHVRGNRTSRSAAIAGVGAPTRPPTPALRATLRERRGRPEPGPPCGVELLAEAFTLALPPIPVTLRARQLLAQTSDLFLLPLEQIVAFGPGRLCALIDHTRFMAASRQKYKYGIVDLAESPAKRRPSETGRYSAFWPGTAITSTRSRLSAMTTRRRRYRTVRRRSGSPFRRRTEAIETMSSLPRSNS